MKMSFNYLKSLLLFALAWLIFPVATVIAEDVSLDPGYIVGDVRMGNTEATFNTTSISTNASGGGYTASKTTSNSSTYQLTVQGGSWNYNFTSSAGFTGTNASVNTNTSSSVSFNNRTLQVSPGQAVMNNYVNTGAIKLDLNITGDASTSFSANNWSAIKNITTSEKTQTSFSASNSNATTHRNAYWYAPVVPNEDIVVSGYVYVGCSTGSQSFYFTRTVDVYPGETVEIPLDINFTCPPPGGGGGGGGGCTTKPFSVTGNVEIEGVNATDFLRSYASSSYYSFNLSANPSAYTSNSNICADTYTTSPGPYTSFIKAGSNAEGTLRWPYVGGNSINNRITMLANQTVTKNFETEAVPISGEIRYTGTVANADLNQYTVQILGEPKVFQNGAWINYLPANYGLLSFTRNYTTSTYKRPSQLGYFNYLTPGDWYTGQWTARKLITTPYRKQSDLNFIDYNNHYDGGTTYNFGTPIHIESGVPKHKDFEYCMGSVIFRFRVVGGGLLTNPQVSGTGSHKNSSNKIDLNVSSVSGTATVSLNSAPEVEIFGPPANYNLTNIRVTAQDGSLITFPAINLNLTCGVTKYIDIPGPTLTVTTPEAELITNAQSVPVGGTAYSGSSIESVTVNGQTAALTPVVGGKTNEVSFNHDLPLADGKNTITVVATDAASASATDQLIIFVDRWLPTVSIAPASGSSFPTSQTSIPISVQAADRGYGYTFEVYVDGVKVHTATGGANDTTAVPLSYSGTLTSPALGEHTITAVATDRAGNNTTTSSTIQVYQTNPPPVVTPPPNIITEATGPLTQVEIGTATATDDDGIASISNNAPAAGYPLGTRTVTWTAVDNTGNPGTANQTVTVRDTTPPTLSVPATIVMEAMSATGRAVTFTVTATDLVDPAPVVTCIPTSGSTFPLGSSNVSCTARDFSGNVGTGSFIIIVRDTTPPTLVLPADKIVEATSTAGAPVTFTTTATDTVDPAPVKTCVPASGSVFPLGVTTVTCTARDASSNTTTGTFQVTVVDTTLPVLTVPADKVVEATAPFTPVVIGQATATDIFPVTITNNAPAAYPVGITFVTWTARDTNNNTATKQQKITVVDTTPPVVTPPPDMTVDLIDVLTQANIGTATATDAVGVVSIISSAPAAGYPLGTTIVIWTARDAAGNIGTATQKITVVNNKPPVLDGLNNQTLEGTSPSGATASFNVTATSTCNTEAEPVFAAPALTAQENSTSTGGSVAKTFQWTTVTAPDGDAVQYQVQLSNTLDFATVNYSSAWQAGTTWTQSLPIGTWYWRVTARDSVHPELQATATGNSFTIANNGTSITVRLPIQHHTATTGGGGVWPDAGDMMWAGPFFEWDGEWWDVDRSFLMFDTSSLGAGTAITAAELVLDYSNGNYMWSDSMTTVYGSTWEYPGDSSTFSNVILPPLASQLISTSRTAGPVRFTIPAGYIMKTGITKFALAAADETAESADPGYSRAGSYLEITYAAPAATTLQAPTLISLENATTNGGEIAKTFQWSAVTAADNDPVQYLAEISSDSHFSNIIFSSQWQAGTTWTQSLPAGNWYWRVTARDSVHTTTQSSPAASSFSITLVSAPVTPEQINVTCSATSGAIFQLGTTTVACTATDTCNKTAEGSFTIQVQDTTPPTLTLPANIVVDATSVAGTPVTFNATATDIVDPAPVVTCSPASGSLFPLDTTTVNCTARDASGNFTTGSFTVTAVDAIAPVLIVPADKSVEATGPLTLVETGQATATDNLPVTITNNAPASYPLGTTIVTWTAKDANNNSISKDQKIIVQDTTPPVLSGLNSQILEAASSCTAQATFTVTANDLVDANPAVTCSAVSGASFTLGETLVNCTATDAGNNTASGTFTVKVQDTTPPILTVPADLTVEATGIQTAVQIGEASATDSCPPVTITNNAPATFPVGTTIITWTATDANGNVTTKQQTITVQDTTAPVLSGLNNQLIEAASSCSAPASFTVTAIDNIDTNPTVTCSAVSGSTFSLGESVVTCSATDASGNTVTGTFIVKVQDTMAPELTVPADKTVEATGPLTQVALGQPAATDSCPPITVSNNAPSAGYPVGTTIVIWTAVDANGNTTTKEQKVTVTDTTPPLLVTGPNQVLEATSPDGAIATIAPTATDLADQAPVTTCSPVSGSNFPLGTTTVNCTATDRNGNSASASLTIAVQDTTPPNLTVPETITVILNTPVTAPAVQAFLSGATAVDIVDVTPTITHTTPTLTSVGTKVVTFTAVDDFGNTTTKTAIIKVIYGCGDTYLNNDAASFSTPITLLKPFKLGSTIPVKLHLCDANGADVMTASPRLYVQRFSGDEPVGEPIEVTSTSGADTGNYFRALGNMYMYNLATKPLISGFYQLQAVLDDGTTRVIPLALKQ